MTRSRSQSGRRRQDRGRGAQLVPGQPDAGGQREHGRHPGDDAEQAESLAAPVGRKQGGGERAGGDTAQAEADAPDKADAGHHGLRLARQEQHQGRGAEQHRARPEHGAVAEPPDDRRRSDLGDDRAEQEGAGDQPGARAARAGRGGEHRHDGQQQEEAQQRRELGQERQRQRRGDEPRPGGWPGAGLGVRQSAHISAR